MSVFSSRLVYVCVGALPYHFINKTSYKNKLKNDLKSRNQNVEFKTVGQT